MWTARPSKCSWSDSAACCRKLAFITEEETVAQQQNADLQWIIDPLDGTTNYLYGLPHYSISVGLRAEGEMMIGIVHHVPADELFFAWRNGGAWCNDRPIKVSPRTELREALVSTGFPYHNFSRAEAWFDVLRTSAVGGPCCTAVWLCSARSGLGGLRAL